MSRKNIWLGLLFLLVLLPSTLPAQSMMHGQWWHRDSLKQELELTDDEVRALDEEYTASRRKMIDLKAEVEKQRFELDLLFGDKEMDRDKIMERYEILEQARRNLSRERFQMFMEIRDILGAERFQELKAMHREYRKDRRRLSRDRSDD